MRVIVRRSRPLGRKVVKPRVASSESATWGASRRLAASVDRLDATLAITHAPSAGSSDAAALQQFEHAVQALQPALTPVRAMPAH